MPRYSLATNSASTIDAESGMVDIIEPSRGKTNNVVSEQVRHKPGCTSTGDG